MNNENTNNEETHDLDIDSYNYEELLNIFKLSKLAYLQEIHESYYDKQKILNKIEDEKERKKMLSFFKKAYDKILITFRENEKKKYKNDFLENPEHKNTILRNDTRISTIPIKKTNPPINDIFQNNYPKGVLNPIKRKEITKIVSLDSIFRKNYKTTISTDYVVDLPEPINNVISMELISLEFPNLIYYMSEKSKTNKLSIHIKFIDISNQTIDRVLESRFDVIIPDTTSSIGDLAIHFNNRFNERGNLKFTDTNKYPNANPESFIGALLHAERDQFQNKLIIRRKNFVEWDLVSRNATGIYDELQKYDIYDVSGVEKNTSYPLIDFNKLNRDETTVLSERQYIELSIDFNPYDIPDRKSLAWKMGFRKETTINVPYYPPTILKHKPNETYYLYMSPEATYGENIDEYFFLYVDDFVGNHNESIIVQSDNNYLRQNILARIQRRNTIMFESNQDNNSDFIFKAREYFGPVNIKKLRLKLIDKFGDLVELNNVDYSLALKFTQLYNNM